MNNKVFTGIYQQVGFSQFCDSFSNSYKNNFSYKGKRALFDYLEEMSEGMDEPIELDTIALCCEYSEYESAMECAKEYGYGELECEDNEDDAIEWLEDRTSVITFDSGIIIAQF